MTNQQVSFKELLGTFPDMLDPEMRADYLSDEPGRILPDIAETASFTPLGYIARIGAIGEASKVNAYTWLGDDVVLGDDVIVNRGTYLSRGVRIGSVARLGECNFFAENASLPDYGPRFNTDHWNARTTRGDVIVGPRVVLPDEVQLGYEAVIPTQDTIGQIGRFGESARKITVYGSKDGPCYSVGCQFGIDLQTLNDRVINHTQTTTRSAADYRQHLPEIEAAAMKVQAAFEKEGNLVTELTQQRDEALMKTSLTIRGLHYASMSR